MRTLRVSASIRHPMLMVFPLGLWVFYLRISLAAAAPAVWATVAFLYDRHSQWWRTRVPVGERIASDTGL